MTMQAAPSARSWSRRRVFITGHTGFKGSWLVQWLSHWGAEIRGYSLEPDTDPSMFRVLGLARQCDHIVGDVRDADRLAKALADFDPEIVFHMAAQSLVRRSYREPVDTFATNLMGTVNLLEATRKLRSLKMIVVVTTDKCYENLETGRPMQETDPLGGHDPYSASKACTELAAGAYRSAFFAQDGGPHLVTVRAGNVIGGGDWSEDRLLPDAARSFSAGRSLQVRNPDAVRPWQHVIDALAGYLLVVDHVLAGNPCPDALNFGPPEHAVYSVRRVVEAFKSAWNKDAKVIYQAEAGAPREATTLLLDSTRANRLLGWRPHLDLDRAVALTAAWYRQYYEGANPAKMKEITTSQIDSLLATAQV